MIEAIVTAECLIFASMWVGWWPFVLVCIWLGGYHVALRDSAYLRGRRNQRVANQESGVR